MNIKKYRKINMVLRSTKGFAMLFAVLTASLLLTIGISIFNISFKELSISTNARESQIAFFAADSARECALYWDAKKGYFPSCIDDKATCTESEPNDKYGNSIICNGSVVTIVKSPVNTVATTTYKNDYGTLKPFIKYSDSSLDPEADVDITKYFNSADNSITTTISARGHNVGVLGRRLERAIEQTSVR
ncbi:MAG: hypothetical protein WC229_01560 [Candidatus Paceibacterota bacterium]|jgi:Tfp pilus assembly protein PilX